MQMALLGYRVGAHAAQHEQAVLVHGVGVEQVVLHLSDHCAELGHGTEAAGLLDRYGWRDLPEVEAGDPLALAASAGPTGAIPGPGTGDDLAAAAQLLLGLRRLVLGEGPGHELRFLGDFPNAWAGQAVEIHDAPTAAGAASVAVRWHGARPALLWRVDGPVRLTCPGLDAGWVSTEPIGEALLGEFAG